MSKKIGCGGFRIDDDTLKLKDDGTLYAAGGGVPKPLTYDYMPEGYPSKSEERVVLFPEQQLTFVDNHNFDTVNVNLIEGQTYSVTWDGEIYECVCKKGINSGWLYIGNDKENGGEDTGEPFFYAPIDSNCVTAFDGKETHTIGITADVIKIVPLYEKFLPYEVMKANNPVGNGSFSMNRKPDSEIGEYSFAEGLNTTASGAWSHAEGVTSTASGTRSHAEGYTTTASGAGSHAEGEHTTASGKNSHAEGYYVSALSETQHVQGKFNVLDSSGIYAHIVGNGINGTNRSNAHTLDWSGNAWFAGTVEGTAMIVKSSTAGSSKRFKITVDDSGNITATEVTS